MFRHRNCGHEAGQRDFLADPRLCRAGGFTGRFVLQWLYSEFKKRSIIPVGFWYLSMLGSTILLAYAIYRQDPVFIAGGPLACWCTCATCS